MWIFLALLLVPIVEIGLFIQVGGAIGLWPTLGIVVLTAIVGTYILRIQGARALLDLRRSIGSLSDPTPPLAHGAMILVAGVLLLTPGFFTDALGFALLVPAIRDLLIARLRGRIRFQTATMGPRPEGPARSRRPDDRVIDGEFTETTPREADPRRPTHPPSGWTRH